MLRTLAAAVQSRAKGNCFWSCFHRKKMDMAEAITREEQLAALLLECHSNREIAEKLGIAPRTVKARFKHMFAKYGITGGVKRVKLAVLLYRKQNQSR